VFPCRFCGDVSYRSLGTTAYCWSHFWREISPRRRRVSLRDLQIPDNEKAVGHFVFVEWIDQTTKQAWVECSLCKSRTSANPWNSLGYPCSHCVTRYGASRRLVLLPPPITTSPATTLEEWALALREAVAAGDVTNEEAMKAWAESDFQDE
jgi:hypothetical protein